MNHTFRKSDRQRAGLGGKVKVGRILFWRGNIVGGSKSERRYPYDAAGLFLRTEGSAGDDADHFQYDHGKKVRIRTVPPRPERRRVAISMSIIFETTMNGEVLTGGVPSPRYSMTGTNLLNAKCVIPKAIGYHELATQYNDRGQLI